MNKTNIALVAKKYLLPFILITSLFFMWGAARSILDVLNKHFQILYDITKTRSALMQAMVYGAYFLGAIPAGIMIKKYGTRIGVVIGLLLFAIGSFLFLPASSGVVFEYLLLPLFVIGCGLVILETAANPYVTLLGDPKTSAGRLNLAQSFNGLGCMIGVLLGGQFFLNGNTPASEVNIAIPYSIIGIIVVIVALTFTKIRLPEVINEETAETKGKKLGKMFYFGFIALIAYEISEISINTFFINYMSDDRFLSPETASIVLSICGLGLFMSGRVIGSTLMKRIDTEKILLTCAIGTVATTAIAALPLGIVSKVSLIVCYIFESIMFPTIFALSIRGLGANTEKASSILMMSVVGGAIGPVATGFAADLLGMQTAMIVPCATFVIVLAFAVFAYEKR